MRGERWVKKPEEAGWLGERRAQGLAGGRTWSPPGGRTEVAGAGACGNHTGSREAQEDTGGVGRVERDIRKRRRRTNTAREGRTRQDRHAVGR